jgi:hypothetical protein
VLTRTRAYFAGLASLLASFGAFSADGSFRGAASRVAGDLSSVASCPDPSGAGQYRVLIFHRGFEHVSSEVYVQWLEWNQDGFHVMASVLVKELSSGMWSVGEPVVLSRKTCSVQLAASHTYSLEAARFVLRPSGRGRYVIREVQH